MSSRTRLAGAEAGEPLAQANLHRDDGIVHYSGTAASTVVIIALSDSIAWASELIVVAVVE